LGRQLDELCGGARIEEIESRLQFASAKLSKEAQLAVAQKAVAPPLGDEIHECPVCGHARNGAELRDRVMERIQHADPLYEQAGQEVQMLTAQQKQAQALIAQRNMARQLSDLARREHERLVAKISERGWSPQDWERLAEARLMELKAQLDNLRQEGNSATEHSATHLQRIKAFREEWRYHQLRDEEQRLRRDLQEGLQPARDRLRALQDFLSLIHI